MDLALLVYAISTLENFKIFLTILMIACAIIAFVYAVNMDSWRPEAKLEKYWKMAKRYTLIFVCLGFVQVMLPSQKTAYTMVGAHAAQRVSENEKVQQMSGKVLQIIEQKLDGYIDEGIKEAKEAVKEKVSK
jgi:D-alanyl-lipoteichoic acid acyltransferase DltB (MBOAT superfamily)